MFLHIFLHDTFPISGLYWDLLQIKKLSRHFKSRYQTARNKTKTKAKKKRHKAINPQNTAQIQK